MDEIKKVLSTFKPWKTPSPDGLHPGFFQKTWDIVAPSLHKFVTDVFVNDLIPAGFNHTHLCLIPNVHNPESVGNYSL